MYVKIIHLTRVKRQPCTTYYVFLQDSLISPQLKTRPQSRTIATAKQNKIVTASKPVTAYSIGAHINTVVIIIINRLYKVYVCTVP